MTNQDSPNVAAPASSVPPTLPFEEFDVLYRALTAHDGACRWQHRLFSFLETGRFPTDVELPTGVGKTSIIALWVIALWRALGRSPCVVPRRLAYVVDRRVVVDQASEFADEIRSRLDNAASDNSHALHALATAFSAAGCSASVLETSTLRGQRALDTRWRNDPSRPAIVVGTVDMIGSRLLFGAYGRVGPWGRSLEAGLLGQDCLVVLDEAHLCSPFAATLAALEHRRSTFAPFAVIRMGATMAPVTDLLGRTPGLNTESGWTNELRPFRLLETETVVDGRTWPAEIVETRVSDRLNASKHVQPVTIEDKPGQRLADWAIERANSENGAAVGLVLNTVAEARRCAEHLRTRGPSRDGIVVLTGSMRGWDRDVVLESKEYGRFRSQRDRATLPETPAFLVATSCVEVGADIDCDHLGTETCSADSLVQRLGRVNRLGVRKDGSSVVVVGNPEGDTPASRVFARLQELASDHILDGAPARLPGRLLSRDEGDRGLLEVRVPPPALTSAVLDDLAMTSKYPDTGARPDVGRWLHGSVEDAALYVELAWRAELDLITEPDGAARLLDAFPISARETARCPLYEAVELLEAIRARSLEDSHLGSRVFIVTRYGATVGQALRSMPSDEGELRRLLHNALIVLPTAAGGYDGRFVDPVARVPVIDVAEEAQPSNRARRCRLWVRSGRVSVATGASVTADVDPRLRIDVGTAQDELIVEAAGPAKSLLGPGWRLMECAGDGATGVLVAREDHRTIEEAEEDDASLRFREPVTVERHLGDAREKAEALCKRLPLPTGIRAAVVAAAGSHDLGKDRPWWQRAVGRVEKPPVAKSRQPRFDHRINQGYRHELGSVADLQGSPVLGSLEPRIAELCLHLVAAHHGHARPGFRAEAIGPIATAAVERAIVATPARFARMQAAHGWWGLAWLEALVKAADGLASDEEERVDSKVGSPASGGGAEAAP